MNRDTGLVSVISGGLTPAERRIAAGLRHDALVDRCTALLAKSCADNAAALASHIDHLNQVAPGGKDAYDALYKSYVWNASQRIMDWRDA